MSLLEQMQAWTQGHKTYALAAAGLASAWFAYFMGYDPNIKDAIDASFAALGAVFIRHGIATSGDKT